MNYSRFEAAIRRAGMRWVHHSVSGWVEGGFGWIIRLRLIDSVWETRIGSALGFDRMQGPVSYEMEI